jgi:hypothetical protein
VLLITIFTRVEHFSMLISQPEWHARWPKKTFIGISDPTMQEWSTYSLRWEGAYRLPCKGWRIQKTLWDIGRLTATRNASIRATSRSSIVASLFPAAIVLSNLYQIETLCFRNLMINKRKECPITMMLEIPPAMCNKWFNQLSRTSEDANYFWLH